MISKKSCVLGLLLLVSSSYLLFDNDDRETYIVYMGHLPKGNFSASSQHMKMLNQVRSTWWFNSMFNSMFSGYVAPSILYTYKRSFNGFVVKLTKKEMIRMAAMDGVVSVFPNEKQQLHTTRSWDFMNFPENVRRTAAESDIVVGVLDTGIWPQSYSFSDAGFGPPPTTWRGTCQIPGCNNKIIGARYYRSNAIPPVGDILSPIDSNGHGTHTASIAAGGLVRMASLLGLGLGTARGGAPLARIAVYKICWSDGCYDADILAAFDDAIYDGVNIISLSVGRSGNPIPPPRDYFQDPIAIGAFHAMRNGILTSASAGNSGPTSETISNFAPWILTVAAGTIDRQFLTPMRLGNNMPYEGISVNTFVQPSYMYPIIYGGDVPNTAGGFDGSLSRYCIPNSLNTNLVRGRIVLCDTSSTIGEPLLLAGAAGIVMRDNGPRDSPRVFSLSATYVNDRDGSDILGYIRTISQPTATISRSYQVANTSAPFLASFSSRGPNPITRDILKPDITAPGIAIVAAWSGISSPSGVQTDTRRVPYNIISGTSMSCPHVTGLATYIKSFYPSMSPAAIKSALMTTAVPMVAQTNTDTEFGYGAGHVNPPRVLQPGLVYDADWNDYVRFLCGSGYSTATLQIITGDASTCSSSIIVRDLNLPSFTMQVSPLQIFIFSFRRTVTNVGSPQSTYNVRIISLQTLQVSVNPTVLSFTALGQRLSFVVTVWGQMNRNTMASATLIWGDGTYEVRSPIVAYALS